jgi:hypothetical protein
MYYDRRTQRAARRVYRRSMRGRRGLYGFPWILLVLLIIFSHTFWSIIIGIIVAVVLTAILLRVFGAQGPMGNTYQQPPQQPYYQPQNPYQQPQDPYQPYDQGYQPPPPPPPVQEIYQEGGQPHPYPPQNDPYQAHDQPQTHYPEQMPPMQQQ